jgi:hypothetical protein
MHDRQTIAVTPMQASAANKRNHRADWAVTQKERDLCEIFSNQFLLTERGGRSEATDEPPLADGVTRNLSLAISSATCNGDQSHCRRARIELHVNRPILFSS